MAVRSNGKGDLHDQSRAWELVWHRCSQLGFMPTTQPGNLAIIEFITELARKAELYDQHIQNLAMVKKAKETLDRCPECGRFVSKPGLCDVCIVGIRIGGEETNAVETSEGDSNFQEADQHLRTSGGLEADKARSGETEDSDDGIV